MGNKNCYCSKNIDPNNLQMLTSRQQLDRDHGDQPGGQLLSRVKSPRVARLVDSLNESKRKLKFGGAKLNEDIKASPSQLK